MYMRSLAGASLRSFEFVRNILERRVSDFFQLFYPYRAASFTNGSLAAITIFFPGHLNSHNLVRIINSFSLFMQRNHWSRDLTNFFLGNHLMTNEWMKQVLLCDSFSASVSLEQSKGCSSSRQKKGRKKASKCLFVHQSAAVKNKGGKLKLFIQTKRKRAEKMTVIRVIQTLTVKDAGNHHHLRYVKWHVR